MSMWWQDQALRDGNDVIVIIGSEPRVAIGGGPGFTTVMPVEEHDLGFMMRVQRGKHEDEQTMVGLCMEADLERELNDAYKLCADGRADWG